jgi:DMSO/TMAO reductase YedYZ molybdopterin-dependent catalytic subunit
MSAKLEQLFHYLDRLQGQASLAEVTEILTKLKLTCDDVADFVRFNDAQYRRNSIRVGRWYQVWALCWKNGQRSPIHDHRGSNCVVQVLRGNLTQTLFEFAPNGHVKATGSADFPSGSFIQSHDSDMHQVSNLQAGDADLVTLHIYSPPLLRMGTYSLTERTRGEDIWLEDRKVVTAFPENSETPLETVQGWVTPNRLFFVRNHFDVPAIDRKTWRLKIEGLVERPAEWTLEELMALPERNVFATVECAGNGRSFLKERMPGVQWGAGAIGHAEWTGVPLHVLLEKSGLKPDVREIVFEGADKGSESDHPEPMQFARSLPLKKALDPDTVLVYRMNGELLSPSHGHPLRLFVPGWYGVASVKWLRRIEAIDQPFGGYYQTVKYTVQRRGPKGLETVILGPMAVKSEIVRPQAGATVGIGMNRLFGIAWAGEDSVAAVDISTDGGKSWSLARLIGLRAPYSWTLWEYLWEVAEPGSYALCSRVTSTAGHVQPTQHDPLNGGYMIHAIHPIEVHVETGRRVAATFADRDTLLYDMNAYAEENSRLPLDVEMEFTGGEGI